MDDLIILIIKFIVRALNSREAKTTRRVVPVAPVSQAPLPDARRPSFRGPQRKRPARAAPPQPTAGSVQAVVQRKGLLPEVVVATAATRADSSLAAALRSRRTLAEAVVLTELIGPPAALRRV